MNITAALKERRRRTLWKKIKRCWIFYALFLPVLAFYIIFHYIPLTGIQIAFKDFKFKGGIWGSPWTSEHGLHHFIRFVTNPDFGRLWRNTLQQSSLRILIGFPSPIILALLLNEMKWPIYKKVLQSISYLPHFVSFVVVYAIIHNFFGYHGFVNGARMALGYEPYLYLGDRVLYKWFYVLSDVWKGVGWGSIIYLASLSRVSVELYEAANIDGATRMQKLWYITLAELRPLISLQFVMTMGGLFSTSFDQTLIMINDMVTPTAETINYYVYQQGMLTINQYSYATAIGLFNSILSLLMVFITNKVAKMVDEDGGIW